VVKAIPCDIDFVCNTRCNKIKNCGQHKCSKKCCEGCNSCTEICGKKLNCLNCRCEAFCHSGPCEDCPKKVSISCACARTVIRIKCGMETRVEPPKCKFPCSYVVCHHKANHACHFGECKPCDKPCAIKRSDCEHSCPSTCHDPTYPLAPRKPVFKQGQLFVTKVQRSEEREAARYKKKAIFCWFRLFFFW
jgi:NF-X1-type zinc finger protein NFXL1